MYKKKSSFEFTKKKERQKKKWYPEKKKYRKIQRNRRKKNRECEKKNIDWLWNIYRERKRIRGNKQSELDGLMTGGEVNDVVVEDGWDIVFGESVVGIRDQQACFADSSVADYYEFDHSGRHFLSFLIIVFFFIYSCLFEMIYLFIFCFFFV